MELKGTALEIQIQGHSTLKPSTFPSLFPTFLFISSLLTADDRPNPNSFKAEKNIYWVSFRIILKWEGFRPGWIQESQPGTGLN